MTDSDLLGLRVNGGVRSGEFTSSVRPWQAPRSRLLTAEEAFVMEILRIKFNPGNNLKPGPPCSPLPPVTQLHSGSNRLQRPCRGCRLKCAFIVFFRFDAGMLTHAEGAVSSLVRRKVCSASSGRRRCLSHQRSSADSP